MDPNTLPGNSHQPGVAQPPTGRTPKPAVVQASVVPQAKKSFGQKFKDAFVTNNDVSLGDWLIKDLLVPTLKGSLFAAGIGALGALFWGVSNNGRPNMGTGYSPFGFMGGYNPMMWNRPIYNATPPGYVDYRNVARPANSAIPQSQLPPSSQAAVRPTDIIFSSRADAELAKDSLGDILTTYHVVTLGDFYETCGVPINGQTDYNVGWTDLSRLRVVERYGAWVIDLPRPQPIVR